MCREHRDFAAEMLLVELEGLAAVAAVVDVGVELHRLIVPLEKRAIQAT
jgi:hypothetical protein